MACDNDDPVSCYGAFLCFLSLFHTHTVLCEIFSMWMSIRLLCCHFSVKDKKRKEFESMQLSVISCKFSLQIMDSGIALS